MSVQFGSGSGSGFLRYQTAAGVIRHLREVISDRDPEEAAEEFRRLFPMSSFQEWVRERYNRTGQLWQSLRLVQRGAEVRLVGAFYANFQPMKQAIEDEFTSRARDTLRRMFR